jgi:hypothetical protein
VLALHLVFATKLSCERFAAAQLGDLRFPTHPLSSLPGGTARRAYQSESCHESDGQVMRAW